MIEAGATSTRRSCNALGKGVPAPPGVVMLAPPEVPRNAESAQSEGRAEVMGKSAAEDSIKAGARKPRPNWPRPPARGWPYRRVLRARRRDRSGRGLRASGWCCR
jgi:hypothetical protein